MELLLWRWSSTAQIASAIMIAAFFVVLGRSLKRAELQVWVFAWLANLAALAVPSIYWLARPESEVTFLLLRLIYFFAKSMFAVCLAIGAIAFVRGTVVHVRRDVIAGVGVFSIAAASFIRGVNEIGVGQSAVIALILGSTAVVLFRRRVDGSEWLATGFAVRAAFALAETFAYATRVVPNRWAETQFIDIILASHSSFDAGTEWAIALGCVLMLNRKIQRELTDANRELLGAKEVLQGLVDRDSLTGLANRRGLAAVLRGVTGGGATIFFFDLNEFKAINDSYGHQTGDDCLKRFAGALRESFRPEDHVIRYAGDEFVVVAPGARPAAVEYLVDVLRDRLRFSHEGGLDISFAVGCAYLPPGGDGEAAMESADEAMYRNKRVALGRRRSR